MIFTRRGINLDSYPAIGRYLDQFRERLEAKPADWSGENWSGRKTGSYEWYEIQDSIDYWPLFERPKIIYQEIQFHPQYAFDSQGLFTNNKVFLIPTADPYLLAVLNSPLMWWYNWRYLPHMKDEALSPKGESMELLPIATPTEEIRAEARAAVSDLIGLTGERKETAKAVLDWLRLEFEIEVPGQSLSEFWTLAEDVFLREVKQRRSHSAARLSPAALRELQKSYEEYTPRIRNLNSAAERLERRLSDLVNVAYGLTPEEVALLWETAPPRMPIPRQSA